MGLDGIPSKIVLFLAPTVIDGPKKTLHNDALQNLQLHVARMLKGRGLSDTHWYVSMHSPKTATKSMSGNHTAVVSWIGIAWIYPRRHPAGSFGRVMRRSFGHGGYLQGSVSHLHPIFAIVSESTASSLRCTCHVCRNGSSTLITISVMVSLFWPKYSWTTANSHTRRALNQNRKFGHVFVSSGCA